jgi:hypothetical protein
MVVIKKTNKQTKKTMDASEEGKEKELIHC